MAFEDNLMQLNKLLQEQNIELMKRIQDLEEQIRSYENENEEIKAHVLFDHGGTRLPQKAPAINNAPLPSPPPNIPPPPANTMPPFLPDTSPPLDDISEYPQAEAPSLKETIINRIIDETMPEPLFPELEKKQEFSDMVAQAPPVFVKSALTYVTNKAMNGLIGASQVPIMGAFNFVKDLIW